MFVCKYNNCELIYAYDYLVLINHLSLVAVTDTVTLIIRCIFRQKNQGDARIRIPKLV